MSENAKIVLAVPTSGPGGIQGQRCEQFGNCDSFTIAEITAGELGDVRVIENVPSEEDGRPRPVELLIESGATAVIVAGLDPTTAQALDSAGIAIYVEDQLPYVAQAVGAVRAGNARLIGADGAAEAGVGDTP